MATSPDDAGDPLRRVDVAVFAKAPIAGFAKTRLIPVLGARGAARLQRELICRALCTARSARLGAVTLWCAPTSRHRFFRALGMRHGVSTRCQVDGDLGLRMDAAFRSQGASRPLLLVGTDCPVLTSGHLRDAARALIDGADAVFYPAEDGGYVLVGLQTLAPRLFENIDWSTPRVMDQTRQRAASLGIRVDELDELWDIDTPQDLPRWRRLHAAGDTLRGNGG